MELDLFTTANYVEKPLDQEGYFDPGFLEKLFRSKIAKSQATGKDGLRIGRFEDILKQEAKLINIRVSNADYRFTTFKERLILRGYDRCPRQISIPTIRDRLTLRATCQLLHDTVEALPGPSPHALVRRVVEAIKSGDQTHNSFLRVDVRDFFPSISHSILERELTRVGVCDRAKRLCMKAASTPTGSSQTPSPRGIPQGLSVSGALASIYMLRFDALQLERFKNYYRYVDDILLVLPTRLADNTLKSITGSLASRGLKAHKKGVAGKTEVRPVSQGIDFLGYHLTTKRVSIRESSYRRMFKNISGVITDFRYRADIARTIFRLNLKITGCIVNEKRRGWMMFFSLTEDMPQLSHLDAFVRQSLKKTGFPDASLNLIKRFIKSRYEIRYNLDKTSYIPNFDTYSSDQRAAVIAVLLGKNEAEVLSWGLDSIDHEFGRLISREVHDLERDVAHIS